MNKDILQQLFVVLRLMAHDYILKKWHISMEPVFHIYLLGPCKYMFILYIFHIWQSLCRTMACFEHDLHTLIYGGGHVVLALYRSYL